LNNFAGEREGKSGSIVVVLSLLSPASFLFVPLSAPAVLAASTGLCIPRSALFAPTSRRPPDSLFPPPDLSFSLLTHTNYRTMRRITQTHPHAHLQSATQLPRPVGSAVRSSPLLGLGATRGLSNGMRGIGGATGTSDKSFSGVRGADESSQAVSAASRFVFTANSTPNSLRGLATVAASSPAVEETQTKPLFDKILIANRYVPFLFSSSPRTVSPPAKPALTFSVPSPIHPQRRDRLSRHAHLQAARNQDCRGVLGGR
jgi:hypothetical protein